MDNVFLGRVTPLLKKGALSPLQESDVPMVPELERTAAVQKVFEEMWAKEVIMPLEKRSLWRALLRSVGLGQLAVGLLLAGVSAGGAIGPPLILKAFSDHFSGQYVLKDSVLWILVALLLVLPTCSSVCMVPLCFDVCILHLSASPTLYRLTHTLSSRTLHAW